MEIGNAFETFSNPTLWCQSYLRNPRDESKPLVLREYQREVTDNTRKYQHIILRWGRRLGKCSYINDLAQLTDGRRVTFGELLDMYNNGEDIELLSIDNEYTQRPTSKVIVVDNGIKPVYEILTRSGKCVNLTKNHPLLTIHGWKQLKDISVGDSICVPSHIHVDTDKEISDDWVKVLAYLLGDGCIRHKWEITFGNEIQSVRDEYLDSIHNLGFDASVKKRKNDYIEYRVIGKDIHNRSFHEYFMDIALFRTNSHTKFIPNEIMVLSKRQQKLFLSRLFSTDGWGSLGERNDGRTDKRPEIGYCSVSRKLIDGVSHLLTRFGIRHYIVKKKVKYKGELTSAYQLTIHTKRDILKFIDEIGIFGKEKICDELKAEMAKKNDLQSSYFDKLPGDIIDSLGLKTSRKLRRYNRVSRRKLREYALEFNHKELLGLVDSDVYWDEIVSIRYIGRKRTVEVQADPYHNYITNDVLVHNSLVMCSDCLWWAQAYPLVRMFETGDTKQKPFKVLIFTPYESHIKELWNTFKQLIGDSPLLADQVVKVRTSDIHKIEFKNGSVIQGCTIGISSSNQGTSVRGLCLDGSTRVSMSDGTTKFISDILIGDKVISYDQKSDKFVHDEVVCLADPQEKELYELCFSSGKKVIASLEHKFLTDDGYKRVSDILINDKVIACEVIHKIAKRVGKYDKVIDITKIGTRRCYDITTKKHHNFLANGLVTHNSGDMVYVDEMDYVPTSIMEEVILPITTTHQDVIVRVSSTPSGARELFFQWATTADELGWLHLHYPSWHPDNDRWLSIEDARKKGIPIQKSTEYQVKSVTTSEAYAREYGAEFGEEFGGVYKHHLLKASMSKYGSNINVADPDIFDPGFKQVPGNKYIIGVDWNSYIHGGQVVMLEFCARPTLVTYYDHDENKNVTIDFTNKYRLFYRKGIKSRDSTQRLTRHEVIRLMTHYRVDYLYVDYGAGDTNIEELSLYGRKHPEIRMNEKLRVIDSGAVVEHYDHILQKSVKKRNKSLMINFSVLALEEGMLLLPKEEDSNTRLVGQMRGYRVKNITARGDYAYEGEDHILDAFNLAMYGFQQNYGQLLASRVPLSINYTADPRSPDYPKRGPMDTSASIIKQDIRHNTSSYRDPERPIHHNSPKRVSLPKFGTRSALFGNGGDIFRGRSF